MGANFLATVELFDSYIARHKNKITRRAKEDSQKDRLRRRIKQIIEVYELRAFISTISTDADKFAAHCIIMPKVVIVHPDLGVGGAERLIVDAGVALQDKGHQVIYYTCHHDKRRCFEETADGTLRVVVIGAWIPRAIWNRFHALLAYLKIVIVALYLVMFSSHDLVICDQVSSCIPIFKWLDFRNKSQVIFYCHFPDQLLTDRKTLSKRVYRYFIDWFEERSTCMADIILVNSKFTSRTVSKTFKTITQRHLTVLYPCVNLQRLTYQEADSSTCSSLVMKCWNLSRDHFIFLSLNRFERKKNLALAIEAFYEMLSGLKEVESSERPPLKTHLIVAGGYDERIKDCVDYYEHLERMVREQELEPYVTLIRSPSDKEKLVLLSACDTVVYTPENEHFGIVPLESMALSRPVIATASGGPLETVDDGSTGFLCDGEKFSFANAMYELATEPEKSKRMGENGKRRVKKLYSYETFRDKLNDICFPQQLVSLD